MKILIKSAWGSNDPTQASFPFHHANAFVEAGHDVQIFLLGEAVSLMRTIVADAVVVVSGETIAAGTTRRGKSEHRGAGCRVTPGRSKSPLARRRRRGTGPQRRVAVAQGRTCARRVKRGNLHPEQHQVGGRRRCSPSPRVGGSSAPVTVRLEE